MSSKEKTIVLLIPGFAANEKDTTCLPQQQAFVRTLKKNYPSLKIIVIAFQYPYISAPYQWEGVDIIPMNGSEKGGIRRRLLWWRIWKKLGALKKQHQFIGLLSFWCGECGLVGSWFSKKHGLPHYCWILGQDARGSNKYVKRIQPESTELIALSESLQSTFSDNHQIRPAHVIPPGIDYTEFSEIRQNRSIDILGAGSLIPLKQFNIFLDLVAEIKRSIPHIKAVICGKGPEENKLRQQIESLYLQNNVELKGEVPHSELLQYMQQTKIFLHPSSYEGFSGVCHEALYAGAQIISFHRPMNEPILNWHNVQTVEEMKEKTIDLLRSSPIQHEPVLYHSIDETVGKAMKLFGY